MSPNIFFVQQLPLGHQEISGPLISRKTLGLPNLRSRKKKHTDVWRVQRHGTAQGCAVSCRWFLEFQYLFVLNCFGHLDCFLSWWLQTFFQTKSRLNNTEQYLWKRLNNTFLQVKNRHCCSRCMYCVAPVASPIYGDIMFAFFVSHRLNLWRLKADLID